VSISQRFEQAAMKVGISSDIEFKIPGEMIARFAELTGDFSSLHTDAQFARRTIYRRKVVHGVLPVSFLPLLDFLLVEGLVCIPEEISAQFVQPIDADRTLRLHGVIESIDNENGRIAVNFSIEDVIGQVICAKGHAVFRYVAGRFSGDEESGSSATNHFQCLIVEPPKESEFVMDRISKGDKDGFQFRVDGRAISAILGIMGEAAGDGCDPSRFPIGFDRIFHFPHLLAMTLLSTSVGMCCPGKYATFLDFHLRFHGFLDKWTRYSLAGEVIHVSRATRIIKKSISITDTASKEVLVSGKVNVLVNEPPVRMPPMQSIRENATDMGLKDKVVVVTGASRGIGETIAKMFAAFGSAVAVNYLFGKDDAERIVGEINSHGGKSIAVQGDVSDPAQVRRMVENVLKEYGAVHVLVNNAVRDFHPAKFLGLRWDEVQKDIDVVARGAFNCCQEVIPVMLRQGGGKIINLSTVATEIPPPGHLKYVVAKSALVGLTRSLAAEFASRNIQVNMIVPGVVDTDLVSHISQVNKMRIAQETPMGRIATPVDVAHAAVFLASAFSSFTTGQKLLVTGGGAPYL